MEILITTNRNSPTRTCRVNYENSLYSKAYRNSRRESSKGVFRFKDLMNASKPFSTDNELPDFDKTIIDVMVEMPLKQNKDLMWNV
jgi:hypothetical protein